MHSPQTSSKVHWMIWTEWSETWSWYDLVVEKEADPAILDRIWLVESYCLTCKRCVFRWGFRRNMWQDEAVMPPVLHTMLRLLEFWTATDAVRMLLRSLIWSKTSWNPRRILTMLIFCRRLVCFLKPVRASEDRLYRHGDPAPYIYIYICIYIYIYVYIYICIYIYIN